MLIDQGIEIQNTEFFESCLKLFQKKYASYYCEVAGI